MYPGTISGTSQDVSSEAFTETYTTAWQQHSQEIRIIRVLPVGMGRAVVHLSCLVDHLNVARFIPAATTVLSKLQVDRYSGHMWVRFLKHTTECTLNVSRGNFSLQGFVN